MTYGEGLITRVYEAIRNSPVWGQSMLIITYDEGGGFFDHATPTPSPVVAPGDYTTGANYNQNGFDFTQLGVRVPQSSAHRGSRAMSSITDRTSTPPYLRR